MSSIEMKKISKKRQKSLASTLRTTHASAASAASATSVVPAAAVAHPSPRSASIGSIQPASTTTDQSIRAPSIDQPMLPATLLPVTEPTILVVPVPARSEASVTTVDGVRVKVYTWNHLVAASD